ncbi:MAG TPA: sulfite exporter TauE/SafE family protein [Flavobacterium sp.]|jgi:hypothetical protein
MEVPQGALFYIHLLPMVEYIGYACALVIGLVMGLSGAGGAILTVPVLVYVFAMNPVTATAYSLFIVGTTSAFGTIQNLKKDLVSVKTALKFALPSLIGVFTARKFIIPAIPDILYHNGDFLIKKSTALMILFAFIMCFAAIAMLKGSRDGSKKAREQSGIMLIIKMILAGTVVGLVGAGGGFLFVPILVHVAKLPIKKAAATSLLIIAINSLVGFTGDIGNIHIDLLFLTLFTALAIAGIFTGIYLNRFVNEKQLKTGFGWFVLLMAAFIFSKEIIFMP